MAIHELNAPAVASPADALFAKVREKIFSPLASANHATYWKLLYLLYDKRFGPDAPTPPVDGFMQSVLLKDIEEELAVIDEWQAEDDEEPGETPLLIRTHQALRRLQDSGWLRLRKRGLLEFFFMPREILELIQVLQDYATQEPVFFSAKVRAIRSHLESVQSGAASSDELNAAADLARHLLEHIRNISIAVADLFDVLATAKTTAELVQSFFDQFIEARFIGDYRELRTREHPLAQRARIIEIVEDLQSDSLQRERLIDWYQQKRCSGNRDKAFRLFERDVSRLLEFNRVDEYLDRLDEEIYRVNRRVLATLEYRLRPLHRIDQLLELSLKALFHAPADTLSLVPFAPGDMIAPEALPLPRRKQPKPEASALRENQMSDEQIARANLRRRAREARTLTGPELTTFAAAQLGDKDRVRSEELKLESIKDVLALQRLMTIGLLTSTDSRELRGKAAQMGRGFHVREIGNMEADGPFVSGIPFEVVRNHPRSTPSKGKNHG